MSCSWKYRRPVFVHNYDIKKKDSQVDHALKIPTPANPPHIRVANGVVRGEWTGTGDDRRIGNVVDWLLYEWHYDYKQEKDAESDTNIQNYSTLIRHQIVWWESNTELFDMDAEFINIFEQHSAQLDIHTPFNVKLLQEGFLIPLYDKMIQIAPLTFGNNSEQVIIPEGDDELFFHSYTVNGGKNTAYEEGWLDLTKYYRGGLRTIYGSAAEFDIQSGILLDIWRTKYNDQQVQVQGYNRKWYEDR